MLRKKKKIYCGNNMLSPKITKENYKIGNPYNCMRKGIGVGLNLPVDIEAAGPYKPIIKKTFYCGKKQSEMPLNLDRMGTPTECLRTGIAIGKAKKAQEQISKKKSKKKSKKRAKRRAKKRQKSRKGQSTRIDYGPFLKYILPVLIIGGSALLFSIPLYYSKPKFLLDKNKEINLQKYAITIYLFLLIVALIVILIWKYNIL